MVCKEMMHLLRTGVGDNLTNEEVDALFDWHAHKCGRCRARDRQMIRVPSGTIDPRQVIRQRIDAWYKRRAALLRSARAKLS